EWFSIQIQITWPHRVGIALPLQGPEVEAATTDEDVCSVATTAFCGLAKGDGVTRASVGRGVEDDDGDEDERTGAALGRAEDEHAASNAAQQTTTSALCRPTVTHPFH